MTVKKQKKKGSNRKKEGIAGYNNEITGIIILSFGVLTFLSFFFTASIGLFGQFIKKLFFGLLGIPAYFLPFIIIICGIFIIFKKVSKVFKLRLTYTLILIVLVSALLQSFSYRSSDFENMDIGSTLAKFFNDGIKNIGGGVIGGIICAPLIALFKSLGTAIIIITLCIIDAIFLTNMSVAEFVRNLRAMFKRKNPKQPSAKVGKKTFEAELEDPDIGPGVIEDNGDLSLDFRYKPKVIDFKIEKTSRELKEKTNNKTPQIEEINKEEDHSELIINDMRKKVNTEPGDSSEGSEEKLQIKTTEHSGVEYSVPPIDILNENVEYGKNIKNYKNTAIEAAKKLESTLDSFGVEAKVINISRGPAVTRYELQPSPGVKVSKIVGLSDDISLNLAASGVRIEAPIPGKAAIGIEVPNKEITPVYIREVLESPEFIKHSSKLSFALGKDISGDNIVADIAKMPHLLIAGATGSGKSVCINSLIISLLYKASPEDVKLLMIDPKVVELGIYNGIPHLLIPVVTEPKKSAGALNWAVQEMVNRYKLFAEKGVRDIKGYNNYLRNNGNESPLPQIVIIIDELADLMMVAPNDVEDAVCRLAQMARAAGMHLVIATQRPSVDVITGVIKANIPSRIAFAVSSQVDSRTILDMAGAEKLLGQGDMLYFPVGEPKPIRIKGSFISDKEVEKVVEHIKSQGNVNYNDDIMEEINNSNDSVTVNDPGDNDELLPQAIELVVEAGQASVSLIQRKFKVGYARAARIVDQMEERGIVGAFEGSKPRQVLISKIQLQEMLLTKDKR
ncbi:MAG: DNA translocase FtsK 4TM domain-containing protein [Bacillota bacterium]|nr:DNA translocase FtsK 4TM domain-containing protein [Bacillota bacterium]